MLYNMLCALMKYYITVRNLNLMTQNGVHKICIFFFLNIYHSNNNNYMEQNTCFLQR